MTKQVLLHKTRCVDDVGQCVAIAEPGLHVCAGD